MNTIYILAKDERQKQKILNTIDVTNFSDFIVEILIDTPENRKFIQTLNGVTHITPTLNDLNTSCLKEFDKQLKQKEYLSQYKFNEQPFYATYYNRNKRYR